MVARLEATSEALTVYTENTEILVGNEIVYTIPFGTFQKL